jgi:uncharacterized membrane protein
VLGVPVAVSIWIAMRANDTGSRTLAALFALGFGLALVPEFFYIQDPFADRMNTVFKLYFQSWMILSVASAAAFIWCIVHSRASYRLGVGLVAAVAVAASLTYTPLSAEDWTLGFAERRGLNGMEYVEQASPDTAEAIEWINDNAENGDTLIESPGCSYDVVAGVPMNRVSAFTGVPTTMGWSFHEYQWRRGEIDSIDAELRSRIETANASLDGSDTATSDARFLILGEQETQTDPDCPNARTRDESVIGSLIEAGWIEVFRSDDTHIFVRQDDPLSFERN